MKVKSEREVAQSGPTLSDPIDSRPPSLNTYDACRYHKLVNYASLGIIFFKNATTLE